MVAEKVIVIEVITGHRVWPSHVSSGADAESTNGSNDTAPAALRLLQTRTAVGVLGAEYRARRLLQEDTTTTAHTPQGHVAGSHARL